MNRQEHFDAGAGVRIVHETDGTEGRARAYAGKKKVGELTYHRNQSYFPKPTLYPDRLDVAETHRGRGIGTALHGAALQAHPDLEMTHTVDGMSEDAHRMVGRLQQAHPGRHRIFDEETRSYRA